MILYKNVHYYTTILYFFFKLNNCFREKKYPINIIKKKQNLLKFLMNISNISEFELSKQPSKKLPVFLNNLLFLMK